MSEQKKEEGIPKLTREEAIERLMIIQLMVKDSQEIIKLLPEFQKVISEYQPDKMLQGLEAAIDSEDSEAWTKLCRKFNSFALQHALAWAKLALLGWGPE